MDWDAYGADDGDGYDAYGGGGGGDYGFGNDFDEEEMIEKHIKKAGDKKKVKEPDMFVLERVQWRAYQPKNLKRMVASARRMLMGTRDAHIIRVELDHTEDLEDIGDLAKKADTMVKAVYLDPTGAHVLITLSTGDNYYLNESWKKPKPLPKMKDVLVTSVAWDGQNTDKSSSQTILIGSSKGQLFECILDMSEKGHTRVWKPVFNTESGQAIQGLTLERLGSGRYYIMAVTATQMYEFSGGRTLIEVFENYDNGVKALQELPGAPDGNAELHLMRKSRQAPPFRFAWMAESGVFHGTLKFKSDMSAGDSALQKATLLKYPDVSRRAPTSMAMTDHHFMFVYLDKFQCIRQLDESVVYEQILPQRIGKVQGLCIDETQASRPIWVYAEAALFQVTIIDEERDVAALHLKMGQFELARQFSKTQTQLEEINSAQADRLFQDGKYEQAAAYYGKTDRQFEEVTLKFIDKEAPNALRAFLVNKLQTLTMRDSTQKTMLCTWLVEIYLNRLNTLQEFEDEESRDEMQAVSAEFRQMLDENKAFLDYKTTIGLISSHGRYKEMIFYANLMEDYERVINAFINAADYKNALIVLQKQTSEELFYRFSPVLMANSPYHTVNAWTRCASFLKPRKLIPALMRYDPASNPEDDSSNQAIRYLEFCTKKFKTEDEAIHNYLLSLYCQDGDDEKVCEFIEDSEVHFDLKYGLRLCSQHKLVRGQVLIYGLMELFEEAVDLALTFDLELAKVYASKPEDDDQLRKRLWLRIAKHVVTGEGNIKQAMLLLKECAVLKIEDILPFFPEFTLIDNFKDEICESLEEYNLEIEQLREAMDMSTQSADEIRSDIQKLNQNYGFVEGQQRCQICDTGALTREFYLFPCQHVFHSDCLTRQMMEEHFDDVNRHKFNGLMTQLRQVDSSSSSNSRQNVAANNSNSSSSNNNSSEDAQRGKTVKLKSQIDDLVAPECPLCGAVNIKQIHKPFVRDDQEASSWTL